MKINKTQLRKVIRKSIKNLLKESDTLGYDQELQPGWYVCIEGNYGDVSVWVTDDLNEVREVLDSSESDVMGPYNTEMEANEILDQETEKYGETNGFHSLDNKLTESKLRKIIKESIIQVLKESNPTKLTQSFKSKEDMTDYRDMYDPESESEEIGPYMPYRHTVCDDGYDYCGDDIHNDYADVYNRSLKKKLATKGGQMSDDWDRFAKNGYKRKLDDFSSKEMLHHLQRLRNNEWPEEVLRSSDRMKKKWVDGSRSIDDIEDHWDYMNDKSL